MNAPAPPRRLTGAHGLRAGRRRRTSLGALALTGASALRLSLQFLLLPVLARLIGPADYGLVALAMPVILFANVVADGGMSNALGRRAEASRALESTILWLAGGVGLALALLTCAIAWPMGALLHQPRLPAILAALSPILFMNGLTAASNGRIIREGRFAAFAAGDLISSLAGAVVAVVAAFAGLGAWSLVAQQLTLWICKLAWVSFAGGLRPILVFRWGEAADLARFGAHTIGATLADFVSRNIDNLIVGGVLGTTALGFYAMAYQVIRAPDMLISGPFYLYIFTAIARMAHEARGEALQALVVSALRLAAAAFAPLFLGLMLTADLAVPVLLGPKWTGAVAPLQWLPAAGFFFSMCSIIATTLMGLGRTAMQLRLGLVLGGATIVLVAAAAPFGVTAVSAALALGIGAVSAIYLVQLGRSLAMSPMRLLAAFAPAAWGCAAMTLALSALRLVLTDVDALAELSLLAGSGAAVYAAVIWVTSWRRLLRDAAAFATAQADRPPEPSEVPDPLPAMALGEIA
jgi:PST family polysaccharide transporter